jgi:N utilization substance protein A
MREIPFELEQDLEDGEHRCEYVGPTGIQCRNMSRPGSRYCGIHEKLVGLSDGDVSVDPDSLT